MPVLVTDYTWEETESFIYINVPLKGVTPSKVDIFSSGRYLKISYPPYLCEVYLKEAVNEFTSKCKISSGLVKFEYEKCQPELWKTLQAAEVEDKKFMVSARQKAIEDSHKTAEALAKEKAKEKREQERFALREQMKKDEEERKKIEEVKENIRKEATKDLERWEEESKPFTNKISTNGQTNGDIFDNADAGHADDEDNGHEIPVKENHFENKMTDENNQKFRENEKILRKAAKKVKKKKDLPPPRSKGKIEVTFSPRVFKTPSRESKAAEEQEWLAKVAAAGRTTKTDNTNAVDMEEMNPLWLKDKGSTFYKSGNFVAAINAFTAAIVLDGNIPSLYSNRAACHLQMRQYKECIQDCTVALELLTPPVQANALSRCKALVRRGTAQVHLENYVEALVDYEAAIELDSKNSSLQDDVHKIRNIIQGT